MWCQPVSLVSGGLLSFVSTGRERNSGVGSCSRPGPHRQTHRDSSQHFVKQILSTGDKNSPLPTGTELQSKVNSLVSLRRMIGFGVRLFDWSASCCFLFYNGLALSIFTKTFLPESCQCPRICWKDPLTRESCVPACARLSNLADLGDRMLWGCTGRGDKPRQASIV